MVSTDDASVTRVKSRDGTEIAYWTSGEGPPLMLVSGMTADHTTWRALSPYLEPHAAVHAMDRRGRGASGDGAEYDLGREFEDVAAVVDAVAEVSGSAVDVLGHSFGGLCAFAGAALTTSLRRLVLYEGWPVTDPQDFPPGLEERLDALLAQGDREAVLEAFMREVVELSEDERSAFRAQPEWQNRLAVAYTITREHRTEAQAAFDPEQAAAVADAGESGISDDALSEELRCNSAGSRLHPCVPVGVRRRAHLHRVAVASSRYYATKTRTPSPRAARDAVCGAIS